MIDGSFPAMFIVAVIVVFVIVIVSVVANDKRKQELTSFAKQWNGRLVESPIFGGATIELDFGGVPARVTFTSSKKSHSTHLSVPLRLALGRLQLRPHLLRDIVGNFLGMEDIEIGVPDFDKAFVIHGSNPQAIADLLTPDVRDAIFAIGRYPYLSVGSGRLQITITQTHYSLSSLSVFAKHCRALFGLLRDSSANGIEFVATSVSATKSLSEPECQICGSPLENNIVYCAKCKTPHHRDCWQYFGSCSVYGCGQKRFVTFADR